MDLRKEDSLMYLGQRKKMTAPCDGLAELKGRKRKAETRKGWKKRKRKE